MVTLEGIHKRYDRRCALRLARFAFAPGRRYAVIGPNGSGKTTLLRVLCGALAPDEGCVQIPADMRETLGYMPQHPYAFDFSVLRNVMMALPGTGADAQRAANGALLRVGLDGFARRRGTALSGGEAQRMALARMIVRPRKLLVLDEPTSATDIAGNDMVERALLDYCKETGCTLVFATHSPAQAGRLAQEVLVLDGGELVESGDVRDVLRSPAHERTISFLSHWRI